MAKNKKFIFGFDMDGVLIDHTLPKMKLAKKFGLELKPEQTPSEIFNQHLPKDIKEKIQKLLYDHPVISLSSPLMKGTKTILAEVKKGGGPFFLISRRENKNPAIRLLKKRELWPKYFNTQNSFFVDEPRDKEVKAPELRITHYIDDQTKILDELKSVKNKFLFDRFGVIKNESYQRIGSWAEFRRRMNLRQEKTNKK